MQIRNRQVPLACIAVTMFLFSALAGCSLPRDVIPEMTPTDVQATPIPSATIVWFPPTSTPTRQITIQPSATPDASIQYGDQVLDDQFEIQSDWTHGSFPAGNIDFGDGSINLAVASPSGTLTSLRTDTFTDDFYLEVSITANLCKREDTFGVVFWATNDRSYHRLAFNCSGLFRLEKVSNGKASALTDWSASAQAARTPGVPFRVGLWVGGGLVRIYLNDAFQTSHKLSPTAGGIGFFASSNATSAVTIRFSDLQLYEVSAANYPATSTPTVRPTKTALPTIPTP